MSSSQTLGGPSRCGRVIGPSLDKIIKNAAWRKHSDLVSSSKSALNKLQTLTDFATTPNSPTSPLANLTEPDAAFVIAPLLLAIQSAFPKVIEPALDCVSNLFSLGLFRGPIDPANPDGVLVRLIECVCKCVGISNEEGVELGVLRVLLSAVRSSVVLLRGECLLNVVRTCYNVYFGGLSGTIRICAKAVLAQIVVVVFARAELGCVVVGEERVGRVSVGELLEFTDKELNEGSSIHFCQGFVDEVMAGSAGVEDGSWLGEGEEDVGNKIREDAFLLFRNLCKLSMKFSGQENTTDDQVIVRGKTLSLELLKVVMQNAGPVWRTDDRFINAMKQYLCLSLLKNSALSVMAIFQLQCSIFMVLLTKFRSVLKAENGIFFPMFVLRVVENVLQPSFVQKMTVLNLLEKIAQDPQILVDIYVNYDCDVESPNIFERTINGLLKTAIGPPPGSTSTLSPVQDMTFRYESVKCLVSIIKSMGTWMDQQLRIGNFYQPKQTESDPSLENYSLASGDEGTVLDAEIHADENSEVTDAATLEQRRAYKLELQGINLFNRRPSKGIDFLVSTKKIDGSPKAVASFLKNATGLTGTMIGDYLGEREEFSIKVMHAYVDFFNFKGMDFSEAMRFFLQGFKLPGEAQKIDRIMEKFAERYCKCNPSSFSSADTAYVLAYSVILLNTDAHNSMVNNKMTKDDFIRNNRGIDNGKDLPVDYLGAIYDQIVKNEIKMYAESSAPQSKQASSLNKLLGFDNIFNLVTGKQSEEKLVGTDGFLIRHIQEQFKANSGSPKSVYHAITDVAILRFMMEVCWGPILAALSVTLDQSDDRFATSHCLHGFRYAVHVAAVMGMHTQRDAFVTSIAKFTYLHHAADMKQKNIDAVKAIIAIAIEDGDYLQEAWEHILTCLSRIEHLQLLGEGAPTDASFMSSSSVDPEDRKSAGILALKRKATLQSPAVMAVVRGGSYDSSTSGTPGLVTHEQISNFISNLNLLDQIGTFELNHVFAHSQRLNSEAIVAFVEALCKVAMSELQSLTDPRVFSLTKLVEIAHYNMNRIRLVWSRIWSVLSVFFVSVGLSENLSVSIFVMDSLRQLAVKFLEREELANYNFQNEFLRPFVIVMQKSNCAEIRELIVRCISQMVLSRVKNVKSGWKSVFMVFTEAATDELKSIVILAFETMEKIVREYFLYVIETEMVAFTYCIQCLSAFTTSKFNNDVSLNAIANLRFCAVKLADGGFVCKQKSIVNDDSSVSVINGNGSNVEVVANKDDNALHWLPLLTELSKLSSDSRIAIRVSALGAIFEILNDHGHLFSSSFWLSVFSSVILPLFNCLCYDEEMHIKADPLSPSWKFSHPEGNAWDSETTTRATKYLVELFVNRFNVLRSQLPSLVSVLMVLIRNPVQAFANTGLNALLHVTSELDKRLSKDEWTAIFLALKEAILSTLPGFIRVLKTMDNVEVPEYTQNCSDMENPSEIGSLNADIEEDNLQTSAYVVSRIRGHISVQLLIMQVVTDLYKIHHESLSAVNVEILLEIVSSIAVHANQLNLETILKKKLQSVCTILEIAGPPIVSFENDAYRLYLAFLHEILETNPSISEEMYLDPKLVDLCQKILQMYLNCAKSQFNQHKTNSRLVQYRLPLSLAKKEELATRSKLVVSALQELCGLRKDSFKEHLLSIFPLLVELVQVEHSSKEIQHILCEVFRSCIGPTIIV